MALMPIVSACTMGWSSRPSRVVTCSIANTTAENNNLAAVCIAANMRRLRTDSLGATGTVLLSDEATGLVPGNDVEVPVVFPGYLLPVDSLEDAAHEGS